MNALLNPAAPNTLLAAALAHESLLRKVLWRYTRNWADVDELLQEVYVRFLGRGLEGIRNVRGYCARAAFHVGFEHMQRQKVIPITLAADLGTLVQRKPLNEDKDESIRDLGNLEAACDETLIEDVISQHQDLERIVSAINQLPAQVREVLVLRKVYGETTTQIRARTKLSADMIERRISAGVRELAAILGRDLSRYGGGVRGYEWQKGGA
jgi:RNA polymerase sigma factor (sigma-70 family)